MRPTWSNAVAWAALLGAVAALGPVTLAAAGCGAASPKVAASTRAAAPATPSHAPSSGPAPTASSVASPGATGPVTSPPLENASEPPLDRPTRKHPLRVYFGGDSLSGMPAVMLGMLTRASGLARVKADYVESSRLTYDQPVDWPARVKQQLGAGHYDVGVFMIGANDTGMPMIADGQSVMYPKKAWLEEYERRAKRVAVIMLRSGVKRVYWVGMPIMPSASESKKVRGLNEVFRGVAASSPDVVYVDSYDLLSTTSGAFNASLRSGDGVHYTDHGAMLVAKAVWKAFKADWTAAP